MRLTTVGRSFENYLKSNSEKRAMNRMTKSAMKILDMLRGAELSQKEIIRKSGMTERAVRYILEDLLDHNLISIRKTSRDRRLKLYSLSSDVAI